VTEAQAVTPGPFSRESANAPHLSGVVSGPSRETRRWSGLAYGIEVVQERAPAAAPAFLDTIDVLLRDAMSHPDQLAAWTTSLLTCTGAPLEFSFSTLNSGLRYTVDVGGPDVAAGERLDRIQSLACSLGWGEQCAALMRQLPGPGTVATPRWGAFLGVRHKPHDGCPAFKIYAEVQPERAMATPRDLEEDLRFAPSLFGHDLPLVMVGRSSDTERREFYFDLPKRGLDGDELTQLLAPVGLQDRKDELVDLILSCTLIREAGLPLAHYGVSYSVLPGGLEPVMAIFAFAADFLGGDGIVRRQMLIAAHARGWTLGLYPYLTEPMARRFFRSSYHTMVSFMVGRPPIAGLQVCVSPAPRQIRDDA
jgi:hypothetical protein